MNTRDLRWRDEDPALPEELRGWLREGGASLGDASEVAELRQRLARALGPASGLGGGEPPSGDMPSQGGGAGGGSGATPAAGPAASTSASLESELGVPLAPPSGADAPPAAPNAARPRLGRGARAALGGAAVALGVSVYAWRSSAPPEAAAPGAAIAGAGSLPPPAPPSVTPPAEAPAPTPPGAVQGEPPPPAAAEGRSTPPDAPRRARSKLPLPPQIGEAALLERARHELGTSPARALAMTREHEQRFPRGVLAQEREVIAIEALKRLGRSGPAAARAAEFERRYRGSVHRQRLEGNERPPR